MFSVKKVARISIFLTFSLLATHLKLKRVWSKEFVREYQETHVKNKPTKKRQSAGEF